MKKSEVMPRGGGGGQGPEGAGMGGGQKKSARGWGGDIYCGQPAERSHLGLFQPVHAEQFVGILPDLDRFQSGTFGEGLEIRDRVLVAAFRMDRVAPGEFKTLSSYSDYRGPLGDKMHFDSVQVGVKASLVVEGIGVNIG